MKRIKTIGKKGILILLAFMLLFTPVVDSAGFDVARAQQNLQYWHSTADKVYFRGPRVSIYCTSIFSSGSLSTSQIRSYIATARTTWSFLGLSYTDLSSPNGASIIVRGVDKETAKFYGVDPNLLGYTDIPSESLQGVGVGNYQGTPKYISKITGSTFIYLINSHDEMKDSSFCRRIATHEFTHALGYYGHYDEYGSLMYYDGYGIGTTSPSTNERNHLRQIYDYQL